MLKLKFTASTNGKGSGTADVKTVSCTGLTLGYASACLRYGELLVYFSPKTWDCTESGMIYTDPMFLAHVKIALKNAGFSAAAVRSITYSTHSWQGRDFVSFDVGPDMVVELILNGAAHKSVRY